MKTPPPPIETTLAELARLCKPKPTNVIEAFSQDLAAASAKTRKRQAEELAQLQESLRNFAKKP